MLPVQLGLAPGYVLPLNQNCEAWPATSWFSQSLKWVTPCGGRGRGAVRSAAWLELQLQSVRPKPAEWAPDTCA